MTAAGSSFGEDFRLTLLTADPEIACQADFAGVNRIGVDLEFLGKAERQAGRDARLSHHTPDDLARIAPHVGHAALFARTNPIHPGTRDEVEALIDAGARVLMLPHFETAGDAAQFVRAVDGRATAILLIECAAALTRIRDILAVDGVDEVMIGLNDLHLQLRVANHFEVLASPLLDVVGNEVRRRGLSWSIGGVGRAGDSTLPVSSDLVLAQYPRLGATGAWIARSFLRSASGATLAQDVRALRQRLGWWAAQSASELERAQSALAHAAARWDRSL